MSQIKYVQPFCNSYQNFCQQQEAKNKGFMMKNIEQANTTTPNRSIEILNLYHKQSLDLLNLVLIQNKQAVEASQKRAEELLLLKDSKNIPELVSNHMFTQVRDYLSFAKAAYSLGVDAHNQITDVLHKQIEDNSALTHEVLNSKALSGNPISTLTLTVAKTALDSSHYAISNLKSVAKNSVELINKNLYQ
jgi:hypothetical protein